MRSLGAYTPETIHIIDARRTLATGVGGTLINVNIAPLALDTALQKALASACGEAKVALQALTQARGWKVTIC